MKKFWALCLAAFVAGGALAYAEESYNPEKMADLFYKLNADPKNPKQKVNHAKGFCAVGVFEPARGITNKIDVPLLNEKSIPTSVRFSLGGAIMSDKSEPRGMALKMQGKNGESWTMAMLNFEIIFAKNPQEFAQFLEMQIPNKMTKEEIAKLNAEVDSYKKFGEYVKDIGITPSVANTAYYSAHTFMFKDKATGKSVPARWKFVPQDGVKYLTESELKEVGDDFLVENFQTAIKTAPVAYKMYLVYPNDGDATDDVTALWRGAHKELLVGELKVQKYEGMDCNGDVYLPSDLPAGVGAPNDPLFQLRSETYGVTFGRRQ